MYIKLSLFGLGVRSHMLPLTTDLFLLVLISLHGVISAPFWYYYMFIVNSVIRITGGLVVAVFQYLSDKTLYQLMVMKGTVQVLRGGEMNTIDQTEVVPGDIVRLVVSLNVLFDVIVKKFRIKA